MIGLRALVLLAAAAQTPSPLLTVPPEPTDSLRFEAPLPDFAATDIYGRTWRNADLRGKLTVVDLWSTFPNNREHPEFQRFFEKVKGSSKVQVLTFCIDHDYTHAPAYMKQKQYTFPVIADFVLAGRLFGGEVRLPQLWVIDAEGRLSMRFRSWNYGRVLLEVERATGL